MAYILNTILKHRLLFCLIFVGALLAITGVLYPWRAEIFSALESIKGALFLQTSGGLFRILRLAWCQVGPQRAVPATRGHIALESQMELLGVPQFLYSL